MAPHSTAFTGRSRYVVIVVVLLAAFRSSTQEGKLCSYIDMTRSIGPVLIRNLCRLYSTGMIPDSRYLDLGIPVS